MKFKSFNCQRTNSISIKYVRLKGISSGENASKKGAIFYRTYKVKSLLVEYKLCQTEYIDVMTQNH